MSSTFDNTRLPVDVEKGASGGPVFNTNIQALGSGAEVRNQNWKNARQKFDIGYGIQTLQDLEAVVAFFYNRRGRARSFLFKDWSDYKAVGTIIPTGGLTGACVIPLAKTYVDGDGNQFARFITRPRFDTTPTFKVDGSPQTYVGIVDGLITFSALSAGVLTGTFDFDVPVRFDTDELNINVENINAGDIQSLPVIEIFENAYTLNGLPIP